MQNIGSPGLDSSLRRDKISPARFNLSFAPMGRQWKPMTQRTLKCYFVPNVEGVLMATDLDGPVCHLAEGDAAVFEISNGTPLCILANLGGSDWVPATVARFRALGVRQLAAVRCENGTLALMNV